MSDRKNIKVYEDTYERLQEVQDRGVSMDRVINDILDNQEAQIDYAEIQNRCEKAVESVVDKR